MHVPFYSFLFYSSVFHFLREMVFLAVGGGTGAFPLTAEEEDDDDLRPEGFHIRGGAAFPYEPFWLSFFFLVSLAFMSKGS